MEYLEVFWKLKLEFLILFMFGMLPFFIGGIVEFLYRKNWKFKKMVNKFIKVL